MLDFPNNPADGERSIQPNGVTYEWQAAKERWISVSTLEGDTVVLSTGMVASFATDVVDPAWLYCDGQAVDRIKYRQLFNKIGTNYGVGDGSTTFNVPDYRGNFLRAQDNGRGADPDAAGRNTPSNNPAGAGGDAIGSEQADGFKSHVHVQFGTFDITPQGFVTPAVSAQVGSEVGTNTATAATGGNETRPKNIYVRYYIYSGRGLNAEFTGFDDRLAGYADTGLSVTYTGDLNNINRNSKYDFVGTDVTNAPPDFSATRRGWIMTMMNPVVDTFSTQVIYGNNNENAYKIWMRTEDNGTWGAWKLVSTSVKTAFMAMATDGSTNFTGGSAVLSAVKTGDGQYRITSSVPMAGGAYVVAATISDVAGALSVRAFDKTPTAFTIQTFNSAAATLDAQVDITVTWNT
jgi:microcystin-dependent protein